MATEIGLVHFAPAEPGSTAQRGVESVKCLECGQTIESNGSMSIAQAEQLLAGHFVSERRTRNIGETTLLGRAPHELDTRATLETVPSPDNPDVGYIRAIGN
jgi:hypothetical protein